MFIKEFCLKHNIQLAVLFGSRAKGEPRSDSDWDLAILVKSDFYKKEKNNPSGFRKSLLKELCFLLKTSQVDLVILNRVSPFLRYQVAKSGILLFEEKKGVFASFVSLAVRSYSDSFLFTRAGKRYLEKRALHG